MLNHLEVDSEGDREKLYKTIKKDLNGLSIDMFHNRVQ